MSFARDAAERERFGRECRNLPCRNLVLFGIGTGFWSLTLDMQTVLLVARLKLSVSRPECRDRTLSHNRWASHPRSGPASGRPTYRFAGMAGVSSTLHSRLIAIFCLLFILPLVMQPECVGVVRAEMFDMVLEEDRKNCLDTVSSWSEAQLRELLSLSPESPFDLRDLLFFLHIPRTGGRTFHLCFLKHLFAQDQRCPVSYHKLRIDRSRPGCRLISTHDDYSLLDKLPHDMTSVVTSLREPLDRVLSSYEFSIEVAARALRKEKQTKVLPKTVMAPSKQRQLMSTEDIWPWKYLVPMMEQDLFDRLDARRSLSEDSSSAGLDVDLPIVTGLTENDSYDAALIAMPFHDFIHHPAAHELVHNGATFQVAGLTNISYLENAGAIRRCVIKFPRMGQHVLEVAKKRLDRMLYVGLTEQQNESTIFFAKFLQDQISMEVLMKSLLKYTSSKGRSGEAKIQPNFTSLAEFTEEEVIGEMMGAYADCVADIRNIQVKRTSMSLESVKPIKFSRERRKFIPDSVIAEVAELNKLDAELYTHAQVLFLQQQELLRNRDFVKDRNRMSGENSDTHAEGVNAKRDEREAIWGLTLVWVVMILVLLLVGLYVLTKRRFTKRVKET